MPVLAHMGHAVAMSHRIAHIFSRKQDYQLSIEGLGVLHRRGYAHPPRFIWRGVCDFLWWRDIEVDLNYEAGEDLTPMEQSLAECLAADPETLRRDVQRLMDLESAAGDDLWTSVGETVTLYLGAYAELNVTYYTERHSVTILIEGSRVKGFICRPMAT